MNEGTPDQTPQQPDATLPAAPQSPAVSPEAAAISAGAEAIGLPPTLPTAETAPNSTSSSQAGLAAATTRFGGEAAPAPADQVVAQAADIAQERLDTPEK